MGLVVSLLVIAAGAVLAFAVTDRTEDINLAAVGWILIAVGAIGFLLTLMFWSSWWGPGYLRRERYAEGEPYGRRRYSRRAPRREVVEEEVVDEDAGPPPAPP
jgi:hypothetical protein